VSAGGGAGTDAGRDSPQEPIRLSINGRTLDRRAFLEALGLGAGAVLTGALLPPAVSGFVSSHADPASEGLSADADGSWHVDDMWGHWPRYAHPIPYGHVQAPAASWDNVDPIDRMFVG